MKQTVNTRKQIRKSTVLLASMVFVLLTLYACYIIIINQRFASQNFSYMNNDKTQYRKFRFGSRKVVMVHGLRNGVMLMSDSISVEVRNGDVSAFRSEMGNDTLRFIFDQAAADVFLYLPNGTHLVVDSSALEMRGSLDDRVRPEYDLDLRSSSLLATGHKMHAFVGKLAVSASGNSRLEIARYFHVNELDLHNVHNASFAQGWQIGNLKTVFEEGRNVVVDKNRDSVAIHPVSF
jgi:hypothetical protein